MVFGLCNGLFSVNLVCWNVRDLGRPVKRSRVFFLILKLSSDINFLQETHLCVKDHIRLRKFVLRALRVVMLLSLAVSYIRQLCF